MARRTSRIRSVTSIQWSAWATVTNATDRSGSPESYVATAYRTRGFAMPWEIISSLGSVASTRAQRSATPIAACPLPVPTSHALRLSFVIVAR